MALAELRAFYLEGRTGDLRFKFVDGEARLMTPAFDITPSRIHRQRRVS